jgi:hypothetical protein
MTPRTEMAQLQATIRTPRAAAVAGIVFALIFGAALVPVRLAVPARPSDAGEWLTIRSRREQVEFALGLLPFAGIAFLWFIGVIRDRLGDREDRFFATIFLGSGLLFVGLVFVAAAVAGTVVAVGAGTPDSQVWGRLAFTLLNTYALRMAAVFTLAATTLTRRLGAIPRWLAVVGYVVGAVLLLAITQQQNLEIVFPAWVLLFSVYILVSGPRRAGLQRQRGAEDGGAP